MTRVLLVCPEPLGHRQPAGIGVRFMEMARVLAADGHDITLMSPDAGAVDRFRAAPLEPAAIRDETSRAGLAVVQGHAANDLFAHGAQIPVVVDLYDPFIIENLHYYRERGPEVFAHDHATLVNALVRGDFFLCASDAQRLFYAGLLLAAGRVNPALFDEDPLLQSLIAIAPFGVGAPITPPAARPNDVLFGGIYDWYDPLLAIEAVAECRRSIADVTLTFTRHPNPDITPQGKAAEAIDYVRRKGYGEFVRFEPWVPYEERGRFFSRFSLALLTFRPSIETDLAMRTRIYDFLWGEIPVISSPAPGTDPILQEYGAGSVIAANDAAAFAAEIAAIFAARPRLETMRSGARAFVRDHQWARTLGPLRELCLRPRIEPTKAAFAMRLQVPEHPPSILARIRRRIGGTF
jgi:glycosyltransferase involved in cell wall biosynthesis